MEGTTHFLAPGKRGWPLSLPLAEKLELDISCQRLDSTHVLSQMASFGRTKLMAVAIKRFLTQVRRHDLELYAALLEAEDLVVPIHN